MAVAIAVLVAYSRDMWHAMMSARPDPYERILLGIEGSFLAIGLSAFIAYLWRLTGQPSWMANMDMTGFPIWLSIQAGFMHLGARGAIDGRIPPKERIQIGIAIAIAFLIGLGLMARSGDVGSALDALRPYLEER